MCSRAIDRFARHNVPRQRELIRECGLFRSLIPRRDFTTARNNKISRISSARTRQRSNLPIRHSRFPVTFVILTKRLAILRSNKYRSVEFVGFVVSSRRYPQFSPTRWKLGPAIPVKYLCPSDIIEQFRSFRDGARDRGNACLLMEISRCI